MRGEGKKSEQVWVPLESSRTSELTGAGLIVLAAAAGGVVGGTLMAIAAGLMMLTLHLVSTGVTPSEAVARFDTRERLFAGPGYVAFAAFDRQSRRRCTLIVSQHDAPTAPVRRSLNEGAYDRGATVTGVAFWALPG